MGLLKEWKVSVVAAAKNVKTYLSDGFERASLQFERNELLNTAMEAQKGHYYIPMSQRLTMKVPLLSIPAINPDSDQWKNYIQVTRNALDNFDLEHPEIALEMNG